MVKPNWTRAIVSLPLQEWPNKNYLEASEDLMPWLESHASSVFIWRLKLGSKEVNGKR